MRYQVLEGLYFNYVVDTETNKKVYVTMGADEEAKRHIERVAEKLNNGELKLLPNTETEEDKGQYELLGQRIGQLVDRKQKEYGDSWGKAAEILRVLYPDGVDPADYHAMLGIVRVIDKLSRIANGNQGEENAWGDIAGYGLLGYFDKYR